MWDIRDKGIDSDSLTGKKNVIKCMDHINHSILSRSSGSMHYVHKSSIMNLSTPCIWVVISLESSSTVILIIGWVKNIFETKMKVVDPSKIIRMYNKCILLAILLVIGTLWRLAENIHFCRIKKPTTKMTLFCHEYKLTKQCNFSFLTRMFLYPKQRRNFLN